MDDEYVLPGHQNAEEITLRPINLSGIGECVIELYPREGPIPHFHIFSKDKKFDTLYNDI